MAFSETFFKKKSKFFKKKIKFVSSLKKNIFFRAYGQILKVFQTYFHKKTKIASFSCFKMQNEYRNQFMIIL
jgi:hypothetical protein